MRQPKYRIEKQFSEDEKKKNTEEHDRKTRLDHLSKLD